jgi:hypothetical protein
MESKLQALSDSGNSVLQNIRHSIFAADWASLAFSKLIPDEFPIPEKPHPPVWLVLHE